jgi:hypothetical protein
MMHPTLHQVFVLPSEQRNEDGNRNNDKGNANGHNGQECFRIDAIK